ncbi:MAG: hypothetical protein ABSH22_08835 [Tepidisphaeraceae bacterium]
MTRLLIQNLLRNVVWQARPSDDYVGTLRVDLCAGCAGFCDALRIP